MRIKKLKWDKMYITRYTAQLGFGYIADILEFYEGWAFEIYLEDDCAYSLCKMTGYFATLQEAMDACESKWHELLREILEDI